MDKEKGYSKRPIWQWIVIYLIVGAVIYGLIYYFVLAKSAGYSSNSSQSAHQSNSTGY